MRTRISRSLAATFTTGPRQGRCFSCGRCFRRSKDEESSNRSLLDELFPRNSSGPKSREQPKESQRERQVPRLRFDQPEGSKVQPFLTKSKYSKPNALNRPQWAHSAKIGSNPGVLLLKSASTSLCENDFLRLSPRGRHIEELQRRGQLQKVIAKRDPKTLRREGSYYLVFKNPSDAWTYLEHVIQTYKIAARHTPKSLLSAPPPTSLRYDDGIDVDSLIQRFALAPPGQSLDLDMLRPPYGRTLHQTLQNGGYWPLTQKGSAKVILWFDGENPTYTELYEQIGQDGFYRGLRWALAGNTPLMKYSFDSGRGYKRGRSTNTEDEDTFGSPSDDTGDQARGHASVQSPWVVSFTTKAEAQRFARSWHKRRLNRIVRDQPDFEGPIVSTEVAW